MAPGVRALGLRLMGFGVRVFVFFGGLFGSLGALGLIGV